MLERVKVSIVDVREESLVISHDFTLSWWKRSDQTPVAKQTLIGEQKVSASLFRVKKKYAVVKCSFFLSVVRGNAEAGLWDRCDKYDQVHESGDNITILEQRGERHKKTRLNK